VHALFEMAADGMGRVDDAGDADAVAEAISATRLDAVCGPIVFDGRGLPDYARRNVAKTPLVGGQWRRQGDGSYELVIVENSLYPAIPAAGTLQLLG
jgi:branched-chain amino acid transport system substrate-binding protein